MNKCTFSVLAVIQFPPQQHTHLRKTKPERLNEIPNTFVSMAKSSTFTEGA